MPRDPSRIKPIMDKLEAYWLKNPDLRLGQVIYVLSEELFKKNKCMDIFFPEDGEWGEILGGLLGELIPSHKSDECHTIHPSKGCGECDYCDKKEAEFPCNVCQGTALPIKKRECNLDCYYQDSNNLKE